MLKKANVKETEIEGMRVLVETYELTDNSKWVEVEAQIDTPHGLFTSQTNVSIHIAQWEGFVDHMAKDVLAAYKAELINNPTNRIMDAKEHERLLELEKIFNNHRVDKSEAEKYCLCLGEFLRAVREYDSFQQAKSKEEAEARLKLAEEYVERAIHIDGELDQDKALRLAAFGKEGEG